MTEISQFLRPIYIKVLFIVHLISATYRQSTDCSTAPALPHSPTRHLLPLFFHDDIRTVFKGISLQGKIAPFSFLESMFNISRSQRNMNGEANVS